MRIKEEGPGTKDKAKGSQEEVPDGTRGRCAVWAMERMGTGKGSGKVAAEGGGGCGKGGRREG
jgi:hypothetical protein